MTKPFNIFLAIYALLPVAAAIAHVSHAEAQPPAEAKPPAAIKASPPVTSAVCVLQPLGGSGVEGAITFVQKDGYVLIDAEISGLAPGKHGFHIHEYGDCHDSDGTCAGGHFNPTGMPHGGPRDAMRHAGDLGNLTADKEGIADFEIKDKVIRLTGDHSILGRGIIIHADPDDFKTQPSGNSGKRIACGAIVAAIAE